MEDKNLLGCPPTQKYAKRPEPKVGFKIIQKPKEEIIKIPENATFKNAEELPPEK